MPTSAPSTRVWDLTSYFPAFDDAAYRGFVTTLREDLARDLEQASALAAMGDGTEWARLFTAWEDAMARFGHLSSYLTNLSSADTADERYRTHEDASSLHVAAATKVKSQLLRVLGTASEAEFRALVALPALKDAAHLLSKWRAETAHQMSSAEEALAADLGVDGFIAWSRLYDATIGPLSFEITLPDGTKKTVPFAQRRALMEGDDRAVRREAFLRGNEAVKPAAATYAAALNAMAGTRLTLSARRKRAHYLDTSLHDAALSRVTIDVMFDAVKAHSEISRRLLRLGARQQGTKALAWYDMEAPRSKDPVPSVSWEDGAASVQNAFDASYPALGSYFRSMIQRKWIESEQRPAKRPGAYCTGSQVTREERIFMTYSGSMGDVLTLAHEAGHAWHSHLLNDLRPIARDYPMTLAETASTFAEKILVHGLLSDPKTTAAQRRVLIGMEGSHTPAYLLNIPVRFLFESRFHEERKNGTVPATRLCELMVQAQREIFGDTLEEGLEDPWYWATKQHFFIHEISFYNYPYTFGFILSQALFSQFKKEGPSFLAKYEAFLKATGRATCEEAVQSTLGWDLRSPAFWDGAIRSFEPLVGAMEAEFAG